MATCINCQANLDSPFCGQCGQREPIRLSLSGVGVSLWEKFSDSETGLRPTLSAMVRAPGSVPRRFVTGERRRFVHPVSWFVLAATIQLLSIWFNQDIMIALMSANVGPELASNLESQGVQNPAQWAGERYILLLQNSYTWMMAVTFFLPTACVLRLLLWSNGNNVAEHLVWCLYSLGFMVALTGLVSPLTVRISPLAHGLLAPVSYLIYAGFAGAGFYGSRLWPICACILATIFGFICFTASIAVGHNLMLRPELFG